MILPFQMRIRYYRSFVSRWPQDPCPNFHRWTFGALLLSTCSDGIPLLLQPLIKEWNDDNNHRSTLRSVIIRGEKSLSSLAVGGVTTRWMDRSGQIRIVDNSSLKWGHNNAIECEPLALDIGWLIYQQFQLCLGRINKYLLQVTNGQAICLVDNDWIP